MNEDKEKGRYMELREEIEFMSEKIKKMYPGKSFKIASDLWHDYDPFQDEYGNTSLAYLYIEDELSEEFPDFWSMVGFVHEIYMDKERNKHSVIEEAEEIVRDT